MAEAKGAENEEVKVTPDNESAENVTEDSLLKSIQELEAKREEPKTEKAEPEVETAKLEKGAKEKVEEGASEGLKKALDVSETLKEFADLIGVHVDESLSTLQKSVQGAAERDVAIVKVLKSLSEEIGELRKSVEKYGNEPTAPAGERKPEAGKTEVLEKGAESTEQDPAKRLAATRSSVLAGLEHLVKNASTPDETNTYTHALIKFETTGQISESHFGAAQGAWQKLNGAN